MKLVPNSLFKSEDLPQGTEAHLQLYLIKRHTNNNCKYRKRL